MKKIIGLMLLFTVLSSLTYAQCLSGNCKNGKGKYDFGWCVYEGEFKEEKPDGAGTMIYNDYTYIGSFKNGVEHGNGKIIYKDGISIEVVYDNGRKLDNKPTPLVEGEYKSLSGKDANCVSGDCINGIGTYQFSSGNKYSGSFSNRQREGSGVFYFSNGEKFEGVFHRDEMSKGTYTFSSGATYTGNYTDNGVEQNGTLVTANGMSVPFVNGKPILPTQPKVTYTPNVSVNKDLSEPVAKKTKVCVSCSGTGKIKDSYYGYSTSYEKASGSGHTTYRSSIKSCSVCSGKGTLPY